MQLLCLRCYTGDSLLSSALKCADIVDVIIMNDGWRDSVRKYYADVDGVTDEAVKPQRFEIEEL